MKKILPPTEEEVLRCMALWAAIERIHKEKLVPSVKLENGLQIDCCAAIDGPFFERLAEIAEEEYQKLRHPN